MNTNYDRTKNYWHVKAAYGSWHSSVPFGYIAFTAERDMHGAHEERHFIAAADTYDELIANDGGAFHSAGCYVTHNLSGTRAENLSRLNAVTEVEPFLEMA